MEQTKSGWSDPEPIHVTADTGWYLGQVSVTRNGNLYFSGRIKTESSPKLYLCAYDNGEYIDPEPLQGNLADYTPIDPFVDPDEQFILFTNGMGADIYISYHQENDTWGTPVRLSYGINTSGNIERFPSLSRDGKYFFFIRGIGLFFPSEETDFY